MATVIPPEGYALLDTISGPESAGAYDIIYGGQRFNVFDDHPRINVPITTGPNAGMTSSAAGRYQFLKGSWDDYQRKLGLPDFSPASQDQAAWQYAQDEYFRDTGRDLTTDLKAGDISRVPSSLKDVWTSMPGGIEQGISGSGFSNAFSQNLTRHPVPPLDIPGRVNAALDALPPIPAPRVSAVAARTNAAFNQPKPATQSEGLRAWRSVAPPSVPTSMSGMVAPIPAARTGALAARTNAALNSTAYPRQMLPPLPPSRLGMQGPPMPTPSTARIAPVPAIQSLQMAFRRAPTSAPIATVPTMQRVAPSPMPRIARPVQSAPQVAAGPLRIVVQASPPNISTPMMSLSPSQAYALANAANHKPTVEDRVRGSSGGDAHAYSISG